MILELPPAKGREAVHNERRAPPALNDMPRRPASSLPMPAAGYSEVMNQVELEKAWQPMGETAPAKSSGISFWQNEKFGFGDFLDIINPLHHIPIVATVYRNFTADRIGLVPRVIGGALWGRVGGLVAGLVNAAVEWFTGKDLGDHIFASFWGEKKPDNNAVSARTDVGRIGDCNDLTQVSSEVSPRLGSLSLAPGAVPAPKLRGAIEKVSPDSGFAAPMPSLLATDAALLKRLYDFHGGLDQPQVAAARARATIRLLA